jgi:hypothetical protein
VARTGAAEVVPMVEDVPFGRLDRELVSFAHSDRFYEDELAVSLSYMLLSVVSRQEPRILGGNGRGRTQLRSREFSPLLTVFHARSQFGFWRMRLKR